MVDGCADKGGETLGGEDPVQREEDRGLELYEFAQEVEVGLKDARTPRCIVENGLDKMLQESRVGHKYLILWVGAAEEGLYTRGEPEPKCGGGFFYHKDSDDTRHESGGRRKRYGCCGVGSAGAGEVNDGLCVKGLELGGGEQLLLQCLVVAVAVAEVVQKAEELDSERRVRVALAPWAVGTVELLVFVVVLGPIEGVKDPRQRPHNVQRRKLLLNLHLATPRKQRAKHEQHLNLVCGERQGLDGDVR